MALRKPEKFQVGDMSITPGNRYIITSRPDKGNPEFEKYKTTKFLTMGTSEWKQVPFDEELNTFNTGFEKDDRINSQSNTAPDEVAKYITQVKKPFEDRFRVDLDSTNDKFWLEDEKSMVEVYKDKEFNTKNPRDMFELFLILKHGWAVSKTDRTSRANNVPYYVESISAKGDNKNKSAINKADAYVKFDTLFKERDKNDRLYTILEWMGVKEPRAFKADDLKPYVQVQLDSNTFCEKFLDVDAMYTDPKNKEEMENFSALTKLRSEGKVVLKDRKFYLGNALVGNTLKEGAKVAMNVESERGIELRDAIQEFIDK